jgi:hypothetical protein
MPTINLCADIQHVQAFLPATICVAIRSKKIGLTQNRPNFVAAPSRTTRTVVVAASRWDNFA